MKGELTIIDDNAWSSESCLHLTEDIGNLEWLGQISLDVKLLIGAVCLLLRARGNGDSEALGSKLASDGLADVWAGPEDENDGRLGGHI
jgi:hypothetical protein